MAYNTALEELRSVCDVLNTRYNKPPQYIAESLFDTFKQHKADHPEDEDVVRGDTFFNDIVVKYQWDAYENK